MRTHTDEQLVINYLKGDEESLEILIKRYLKPIYSFTFRFIGNSQEVEDITQEVFIKVWRNLKKPAPILSKGFDPKKGKFKTWIFTIAKNTCFDWYKKKRTIPLSEFIEQISDNRPLPTVNFLDKILEKLSPQYRTILFLRYNDHFTFREIAGILSEPLNTVKSRHRRGIALLKKLLT